MVTEKVNKASVEDDDDDDDDDEVKGGSAWHRDFPTLPYAYPVIVPG